MPDVFLSYSREDQTIARHFAEALERDGFNVWWDQALNPGEAFDQVTEEALAAAQAVIVLWSRHSVSSRWVRAEATQANAAGRLLPVMIEDCTRPIMFELTHTANLTLWKGNREDPAWQGFTASVQRFVHKRAAGQSNVPALLQPSLPRPTLQARLAPVGHALRAVAVGTGSLLRRHAGRLVMALSSAAIGGAIAWTLRPQPAPPEVTRFSMELPIVQNVPVHPAVALATALRPALSPDGRRIVYPVIDGTSVQLWSRRLDQQEATPVPGSEGAISPFFSPDSQRVAFFTAPPSFQLKAFDFGGNALRVLADIGEVVPQPGAWDDRGRIFFQKGSTSGVWRVDTIGGAPQTFASPDKDHGAIFSPSVLPGTDWVLLTGANAGTGGGFDVLVQNVATGERKVVLKGAYDARYLPTGHLVFARGGALYAMAFDVRHLAARGREVRVVENVANNDAGGTGAFSLAADGTLAYLSGAAFTGAGNNSPTMTMAVARASRTGEARQLTTELRDYYNPRVSPDGSKVALEVVGADRSTHIWTMDARTGIAMQLTFEGGDRFPAWTADSREVLFTSKRGAKYSIWRKAADGTGDARHVVDGASEFLQATDVQGSTLVYQDLASEFNRDLFTVDLSGGGKPTPLLAGEADEWDARISPDGRWMVYTSAPQGGENAPYRVYARPFPDAAAGGQRAITEAGRAWGPRWSPAGDEIYYFDPGRDGDRLGIHAVSVTTTPTTLTPTSQRRALELPPFDVRVNQGQMGSFYDVSPTGGDFIFVRSAAPSAPAASGANAVSSSLPPRLNVVENWGEELKKIVPVQ